MKCRHSKVETTTCTPSPLIVDSYSDTDVFFSPLTEAHNPFSSSASINRRVDISGDFGKVRRPIVRLCSDAVRRSRSESLIRNQAPCESEPQSHGAGTWRQRATPSPAQVSLQALRPLAQRTHTSDQGLRSGLDQTKHYTPRVPLKTCLKEQAHSTTTTPPGEGNQVIETSLVNRKLRRVKTVDFEDFAKLSSVLPTFATPDAAKKVRWPRTSTGLRVPPSNVTTSCPGPVHTGKSGPADPATTRTDVHVIAIAPSRTVDSKEAEDNVDPATPTMQIVESSNGCYEVVWDNVPDEHRIRTYRRSSSASHSLRSINTPSIGALQRVNTKLIGSSGTWNAPSNVFKPTIVVFPDDDGRKQCGNYAVDDDDEWHVPAPPNSQHTSAGPSRPPSRPASAPASQAVSKEEIELKSALRNARPGSEECTSTKKADTIPDTKVHLTRFFAPDRRIRHIAAAHRPLIPEYADIKFRGHRDSIVLARSRLVHSSDFSEVVLAHRDSLSIAKKRMRIRNHAISTERDIPKIDRTVSFDAPFSFLDDDASRTVPMEKTVQAMESLQKQASANMVQKQ